MTLDKKTNPFWFFDAIFCINLDHRKDRWDACVNEFNKLGIADIVTRFPAVQHPDGRVGIIKSNLGVVRYAKEHGLRNVLVFEDDVKFIDGIDPLSTLTSAIQQSMDIDWDLFYLGANTHGKLEKLTSNTVRLRNAYACHSMAYSSNVYDRFIEYASRVDSIRAHGDILDVWVAEQVQSAGKCIMTNPMLTTQRASFSDIENRFVSYKFIEDRFNENIK